MKWKQISAKNFTHVVPAWGFDVRSAAALLDGLLDAFALRTLNRRSLKGREREFWIEIDALSENPTVRIAAPDGGEADGNAGYLIISTTSGMGGRCQVHIPLYAILKGFPDIRGMHSVYLHEMQGEGKVLRYVGITKQRWQDRLSQHVSSARTGSRLVFHDAIRRNQDEVKVHRLVLVGCSYEAALKEEEELVDEFTLYPKGLNMIPGGKAGFAYLASLGFRPIGAKARDACLEQLVERDVIEGRPNPLCAARWASDQDYINRVICGHSSRLDLEQVRGIRMLNSFGKSVAEIASRLEISNTRQVREVVRGARYARVK